MGFKVIAGEATGAQSVVLAVSFTAEKSRPRALPNPQGRGDGRGAQGSVPGAEQNRWGPILSLLPANQSAFPQPRGARPGRVAQW